MDDSLRNKFEKKYDLWKQRLLWMRYHGASLTTSRADLSVRMPSNRLWRSLPCTVHSMNATWTTTSGRTQ